ncbi:MAG TPA: hypothetical protein VF588_12125 [Pyrinomonadaceae bacterium]|jgi:hypothetical protein
MKKQLRIEHPRLMATIMAASLTLIYPYLESHGGMGKRLAWVAMASLLLCPLLVCAVAGRRFIAWGALTNFISFAWLILPVYIVRGDWAGLRFDALWLSIFGAFGMLFGACAGGFVERQFKRWRHRMAAA